MWKAISGAGDLSVDPVALFARSGVADCARGRIRLPHWLRGLLHCPLHFIANSGDAPGQAGGGSLRAADGGQSLPVVRPARTAGGVHRAAAASGDVRGSQRGGHGVPDRAGAFDPQACSLTTGQCGPKLLLPLTWSRNTNERNLHANPQAGSGNRDGGGGWPQL
jgi:hypothetical protein